MRRRRKPSTVRESTLPVAGIEAPVEVRRHPAARRMTLRVSRTRRAVIVTLPVQCDLDAAGVFVDRHIEWVRERLHSLPEAVPFAPGAVVPVRGEPHAVEQACGSGRRQVVEVDRQPDRMPKLLVHGQLEFLNRRLKDWLASEALRDLERQVEHHSNSLGVTARRIAVRDQSSRWGSCSTTGVLSFSWRLILAPPMVLDYVAAHEVAHLREMNHGPRFWALVRKTAPHMDDAKRWLQAFGMDLHRYG